MVRTVFVLTLVWVSAAISSPLALVFMLLKSVGLGLHASRPLAAAVRLWSKVILWSIGVKLDVSGMDNFPPDERLCFVGNHQGDLDIMIMLAILPRPAGFIAKSQVAWFPFLNIWALALGSAFIVRNKPRQGTKAIDKGVARIRRGHAMIIFPEGTRSRGYRLLPFRNGAFKLATRAEATIVPVSIDGSFHAWEEHLTIRATRVSVVVHPPVRTAGLDADARRALPGTIRATIASGLSAPGLD